MGEPLRKSFIIAAAAIMAALPAHSAQAFELQFDWGNISKCTSGNPGSVRSPAFTVTGVPAGTAKIKFNLRDQDAPSFIHGGGTVAYAGKAAIPAGQFTYLQPCPPGGHHTYVWTATALDASGKSIGSAKAKKQYP